MKTTARIIIILVLVALAAALGRNIYSQASKFKEIYQAYEKVTRADIKKVAKQYLNPDKVMIVYSARKPIKF